MKNAKRFFIVALAMVFAFAMSACGGGGKSIDMSQFITCEIIGANGHADAVIDFDLAAFEEAVEADWGEKERTEENLALLEDLIKSISVSYDNAEDLSNGDKIPVTVYYYEEIARSLKLKLTNNTTEFKVEGLEDGITVDAFDPAFFGTESDKTVRIVTSGISPFLSVYIDNGTMYNTDKTNGVRFDYTIDLPENGLVRLGDVLTVHAGLDDKYIDDGYVLASDTYTFEVKDAPGYVEAPKAVTKQLIDDLTDEMIDYNNKYPLKIIIDEDGSHFNSTQAYTNVKVDKAWLLVRKETNNSLYNYILFKLDHDVTSNKGDTTGLVTYMAYEGIMTDMEGKIAVRDTIVDEQRGAYINDELAKELFLDKFNEYYDFYELDLGE